MSPERAWMAPSPPASATEGDVWFEMGEIWIDTRHSSVRVWNGEEWVVWWTHEATRKVDEMTPGFEPESARPHQVERDGEEFWTCGRCGARAWDLGLIRELDCRRDD